MAGSLLGPHPKTSRRWGTERQKEGCDAELAASNANTRSLDHPCGSSQKVRYAFCHADHIDWHGKRPLSVDTGAGVRVSTSLEPTFPRFESDPGVSRIVPGARPLDVLRVPTGTGRAGLDRT